MSDAESLAIRRLFALLSKRCVGAGAAGVLAPAGFVLFLCARPRFVLAAFPLTAAVARGVDEGGSPPCRGAAPRAGAGTLVSR